MLALAAHILKLEEQRPITDSKNHRAKSVALAIVATAKYYEMH